MTWCTSSVLGGLRHVRNPSIGKEELQPQALFCQFADPCTVSCQFRSEVWIKLVENLLNSCDDVDWSLEIPTLKQWGEGK